MTMEAKVASDRDVICDARKLLATQPAQRQCVKATLVQAAFSHLELAIVNMEAHLPACSVQDQSAICKTVALLQELAGKMSTETTDPLIQHGADHVDHVSATPSLQDPNPQNPDLPNVDESGVIISESMHTRDAEVGDDLVDWQTRLMQMFDQIDADGSGAIKFYQWRDAMMNLGLPLGSGEVAFRCVDTSNLGVIYRREWSHMLENVQAGDLPGFIKELNDATKVRMSNHGRIYSEPQLAHSIACCIIRPDHPLKMCWDMLITMLLFYIAITFPYIIGFDAQPNVFSIIDHVLDALFLLDVCFNFRTAYYVHDECLCYEWRQIACQYLKTWFLLDFATCVPFELITKGACPNMEPAKLLKIGKIAKGFKLLRLSKLQGLTQDSEVTDFIEDQMMNTNHQAVRRLIVMVLWLCLLCHWLACFMACSGDQWYLAGEVAELSYSTALYWAMMTLTTVGFGDIVPLGVWERAYSCGCMAIGGFFYGVMIGKIASIVSTRDLNATAYYDRMEAVQSWLSYHAELPKQLRRRIKKYYQNHLQKKAATDDTAIINDLSPALMHDVSFFLVQEEVKCNVLFHNLPNSTLAYIMPLLEKVYVESNELIVSSGELGVAMYIIIQGNAYFAKGHQWNVRADELGADKSDLARNLSVGSSFGEEVILGLEETYQYTVAAKTRMTLLSISREGFERQFDPMPDIKLKMHHNFLLKEGQFQEVELHRKKYIRGRGSLLNGTTTDIPGAFPDAVLDALADISRKFDKTEQKFDAVHNHVTKVIGENTGSKRPSRRAAVISRDTSEASLNLVISKHKNASPNPVPIQHPVCSFLTL